MSIGIPGLRCSPDHGEAWDCINFPILQFKDDGPIGNVRYQCWKDWLWTEQMHDRARQLIKEETKHECSKRPNPSRPY